MQRSNLIYCLWEKFISTESSFCLSYNVLLFALKNLVIHMGYLTLIFLLLKSFLLKS